MVETIYFRYHPNNESSLDSLIGELKSQYDKRLNFLNKESFIKHVSGKIAEAVEKGHGIFFDNNNNQHVNWIKPYVYQEFAKVIALGIISDESVDIIKSNVMGLNNFIIRS